MEQKAVWKGFGIASLLWVPISLVVSYLAMHFGWDSSIHPLIWLPISTVIVFLIAIPYLIYIGKKSK